MLAITKPMPKPPKSHTAVGKLIAYVINPKKTTDEECLYVDSLGCSVDGAADDFKAIRDKWDKNSGVFAYHYLQSFSPGETTPEEAHQCGKELAQAIFAETGYQVIFGTHLDREHLHNHFVVNAVNSLTGKKLNPNHQFNYVTMREANDRICREHRLSVITEPKNEGKPYAEWISDKNGGFTFHKMIRDDIDSLIPTVLTFKQLLGKLEQSGYTVGKRGKYLWLSPPGTEKHFRCYKLGKGYSEEAIAERILFSEKHFKNYRDKSNGTAHKKPYRLRSSFKKLRRKGGFRGMYYVYLYKLRKLLKSSPDYQRKMPVQARHDAQALQNFATDLRLLSENKINDTAELSAFYEQLSKKAQLLFEYRTDLRSELSESDSPENMKDIKNKISSITQLIKDINRQKKILRAYL